MALVFAGVPHPTGYPLYTLLGHLVVRGLHALGAGWSYAANAWSVAGAAAAAGLAHALALRLSGADRSMARAVLAAAPLPLLVLNPAWVMVSLVAEVHSWHVAWTLAAVLVCVGHLRARSDGEKRGDTARAAAWGLLGGVGLAHHLTAAPVFAALSAVLAAKWIADRRLAPRHVLAAAAAALVPLVAYTFVVWRAFHPAAFQWPALAPSLESVIEHVTGARYHRLVGGFAPAPAERELLVRYVLPVLAAGVTALLALAARRKTAERIAPLAALAALAAAAGYALFYGAYDATAYFLPGLALAVAGLGAATAAWWPHRRGSGFAAWAAGLALAAPMGAPSLAWRREVIAWDATMREMWAVLPSGPAFVLWPTDAYPRLIEYQRFEGAKRELYVAHPQLLAERAPRARFRARFGFDPLAGVAAPVLGKDADRNDAALARFERDVAVAVNRQTPLPVVFFDPRAMRLVLLDKPGGIH